MLGWSRRWKRKLLVLGLNLVVQVAASTVGGLHLGARPLPEVILVREPEVPNKASKQHRPKRPTTRQWIGRSTPSRWPSP
jgi:hypothetical protein